MGRRSDHSREELEALILAEAHRLMSERGFVGFSAREVAKRIGYSVGTIYNVWTSLDRLLAAINSRTFTLWADALSARLAAAGDDRIAALVQGYFAFAREHNNLWAAIYEHRLPEGMHLTKEDMAQRSALTDIVVDEIARFLGYEDPERARPLARSLIATVHGHCALELTGAFSLLEEPDPEGQALARVREALEASGAQTL